MAAPQLPRVIIDRDWFRSDTPYSNKPTTRQPSKSSSNPSRYSDDTANLSLDSAKTSVLSKPEFRDMLEILPRRSVVEHRPLTSIEEPAATNSMASVPSATPDNRFLGFCRGAWNLQNGDQKGSMKKCSEADAWSRNAARKSGHTQYLKCREPKCDFRSNFISSNAFLLWNKVFTFEESGIKLRWPFLAKSHVPQRVVLNSKYSFQCLFCVFLGRAEASTVYNGIDLYLHHMDQKHRGKSLGDVIEYKTRCIGHRIADDTEVFDINLWPRTDLVGRKSARWLSDDLLDQPQTVSALSNSSLPEVKAPAPPLVGNDLHASQSTLCHHSSPSLPQENEYLSQDTGLLQDHQTEMGATSAEEFQPGHIDSSSTQDYVEMSRPPLTYSGLTTSLPSVPCSPQVLLRSIGQMQTHGETGSIVSLCKSRTLITGCLDSIVQLSREAGANINVMRDSIGFGHEPIMLLLVESIREAPSEIEKEKNRATLRFGEAFQYGDYTAISSLQKLASQLRSGFWHPLKQAVRDHRLIDVIQLVDVADAGRYTTIAALHDLKQRLMQSGYTTYQPPPPQAHPAYQTVRRSKYSGSGSTSLMSDISLVEQRYNMPSNEGAGHARKISTNSAISDGASIHVHFREEVFTPRTALRRGSVLGFLKHGRTKSSSLLVDSKQKSDELAERKMKGDLILQRHNNEINKKRTALGESRIGMAELERVTVDRVAKV